MTFIGVGLHSNAFTICRPEPDGSESFPPRDVPIVSGGYRAVLPEP